MVLFGRRINVQVAGLSISQPRIAVRLERQADQTQTKGTVNIYNLAPAHERQIYERGTSVVVEAGYPSTIATVFDGQLQRVQHPREGLARITRIDLGDNVHAAQTVGGISSRSYEGPVQIRVIAADLVADMGLTAGPMDAIPAGATVTHFAVAGSSWDALRTLLKTVDVYPFEDDGVVRFRSITVTVQPDAPTIRVSPTTGLIGSPLLTDEGAQATMFCNPQAKIGGILDLESQVITARYVIAGLRHELDNWEGPFSTWVDLREMQ